MELITERVVAKLALTAALLAIGIAFAIARSPGPSKYLFVDELVGMQAGQRLRVHGWVQAGSIERGPEHHVAFMLQWHGVALRVVLDGELYDTFKDYSEVVAVGQLVNDGAWRLEATTVMANCGNKYDGGPPSRAIKFQ